LTRLELRVVTLRSDVRQLVRGVRRVVSAIVLVDRRLLLLDGPQPPYGLLPSSGTASCVRREPVSHETTCKTPRAGQLADEHGAIAERVGEISVDGDGGLAWGAVKLDGPNHGGGYGGIAVCHSHLVTEAQVATLQPAGGTVAAGLIRVSSRCEQEQ
jgi:hypothetical protein